MCSWDCEIHRATVGRSFSHKLTSGEENLHVGSVGKSPTGIFTGITVRESTEGQSQVFGMWGKLQAIEKANSSCQCQEEQRSLKDAIHVGKMLESDHIEPTWCLRSCFSQQMNLTGLFNRVCHQKDKCLSFPPCLDIQVLRIHKIMWGF